MGNSRSSSSSDSPHLAAQENAKKLPDLSMFGERNINGFYYLKQDQQKAIENDKKGRNHKIPVSFKYTGFEVEKTKKQVVGSGITDNPDDDDASEDEKDLDDAKQPDSAWSSELKHSIFAWVYFICDDGAQYPIWQKWDESRGIAAEYEQAREYLALNDPIPDVFLKEAVMTHKVMASLIDTWIHETRQNKLHCRVIQKAMPIEVRQGRTVQFYHPGLLIWSPDDGAFGLKKWDKAILIHLVTMHAASDGEKEKIEIKCETVMRQDLDKRDWTYTEAKHPTQDLQLSNGLTDIAHWCLQYEMGRDYKYEVYFTDCIQFMKELCDRFGIKYDAKLWSKNAPYVISRRFEQCRRLCLTHC